jgi:hypothetical protein
MRHLHLHVALIKSARYPPGGSAVYPVVLQHSPVIFCYPWSQVIQVKAEPLSSLPANWEQHYQEQMASLKMEHPAWGGTDTVCVRFALS